MASYDIETLLNDVKSTLTSNLNTKISSINSEKNDTITLATIDSNAYFFQMLDAETVNYNPFVLYGIEDIKSDSRRSMSADEITVSVVIVLNDQGQDINITKRLLRYLRALKEVFQTNYHMIENSNYLEIQSIPPQQFQRVNSSEFYRIVGIVIKTSLA